MKPTKCPYCESTAIEKKRFKRRECWKCTECGCLFGVEDIEREKIRHWLSAILAETSEEHPMECDITIGEWDAQGLSSLELPNIVKCFQFEDGTIWFHEYGAVESDLKTEKWTDFDDYDIRDLREIVKQLKIDK